MPGPTPYNTSPHNTLHTAHHTIQHTAHHITLCTQYTACHITQHTAHRTTQHAAHHTTHRTLYNTLHTILLTAKFYTFTSSKYCTARVVSIITFGACLSAAAQIFGGLANSPSVTTKLLFFLTSKVSKTPYNKWDTLFMCMYMCATYQIRLSGCIPGSTDQLLRKSGCAYKEIRWKTSTIPEMLGGTNLFGDFDRQTTLDFARTVSLQGNHGFSLCFTSKGTHLLRSCKLNSSTDCMTNQVRVFCVMWLVYLRYCGYRVLSTVLYITLHTILYSAQLFQCCNNKSINVSATVGSF